MNSSKQHPLVSIVTPSYNQSHFIEDTILSVVRQDYPSIEYIIVDGGSTDGSVEIIKTYAERYPKQIQWLSEPDEGQADAINKGFRMATGQIVAWLNSDDTYLFRSSVREVVNAFKQLSETDVLYGDAVLIDKNNRLLRALCSASFNYGWLLRGYRLTQPAVFFRQRVVAAEKLDPSISIVLDLEYLLRLGREYKFSYVPRLWAADRNHPARKILARRDELSRQGRAIRQKYGQNRDLIFHIRGAVDKLMYGFPSRIRGIFALCRLYNLDVENFAIPIRFDSLTATIWRQLWKKKRDLL